MLNCKGCRPHPYYGDDFETKIKLAEPTDQEEPTGQAGPTA